MLDPSIVVSALFSSSLLQLKSNMSDVKLFKLYLDDINWEKSVLLRQHFYFNFILLLCEWRAQVQQEPLSDLIKISLRFAVLCNFFFLSRCSCFTLHIIFLKTCTEKNHNWWVDTDKFLLHRQWETSFWSAWGEMLYLKGVKLFTECNWIKYISLGLILALVAFCFLIYREPVWSSEALQCAIE